MEKIAVLIPCYNESQTIGKVVDDWKKALPDATVYVYDNNSTDGTAKIAEAHGAAVRYERKQGKGNVVRTMFREVDAECYLMIDGDDTYPAEYGKEMAEKVLNNKADMVIGDRLSSTYFSENKRLFHNSGNALVRDIINRLYKSNIRDIMTGYRAFSYQFAKTFPVLSRGFEIETEMTIHALDKNLNIENVVVDYRDRPTGSKSKLDTYGDGSRVLWTIARLYKNYKPLEFFGWFSLFLAVVSVCCFIPVFITYLKTGLVPRYPTLILSGFIMMAALLSIFTGLILSVIAYKNKQEFEFELKRADAERKKAE